MHHENNEKEPFRNAENSTTNTAFAYIDNALYLARVRRIAAWAHQALGRNQKAVDVQAVARLNMPIEMLIEGLEALHQQAPEPISSLRWFWQPIQDVECGWLKGKPDASDPRLLPVSLPRYES